MLLVVNGPTLPPIQFTFSALFRKRSVGCNMMVTNWSGNSSYITEPSDKRHLSTKGSRRIITHTHTSVKGLKTSDTVNEGAVRQRYLLSQRLKRLPSRCDICIQTGAKYLWTNFIALSGGIRWHMDIKSNHLWPPLFSLTWLSEYENNYPLTGKFLSVCVSVSLCVCVRMYMWVCAWKPKLVNHFS